MLMGTARRSVATIAPAGTTIRGTVRSATGAPVVHATVWARERNFLHHVPRHLPHALEVVSSWPRLDERTYSGHRWIEGQADYPGEDEAPPTYLGLVAVWQPFGFAVELAERDRMRELWKHRPDLRDVLGDAIGYYVCDEFKRPFLRRVLAGRGGRVSAWVTAYPDLRAPLVAYFLEQTRLFNQAFKVVDACITLTRDLGEPPEVWRAAALAIVRDERRQESRPLRHRSYDLRHELETHGAIYPDEGELINRFLRDVEHDTLDVMAYGRWWHGRPAPSGEVLSRLACASHDFAGDRWNDDDVHTFARALAALDPSQATSFKKNRPFLRQIADAAGLRPAG
jgi:hypothetical protein